MRAIAVSLKGLQERWLLAAAVVTSAAMLVAPAAIPIGIALIVWTAIVLGRKRAARPALLITATVVLSMTIGGIALVGIAASLATSTDGGSVTLIEG
ncbi:hypothetical protein [Leifsonia sp. NCR5]|uniref:hypothetical protein n=1 Tax=Leifsonia sp. NCR5 TaxID=1978342 RepID=UPI000A18BE88|nr:hypothetical protein [Leifsonia sp. NCR5]